jgi:predicted AAA+ superfamily ATPase
VDRDRTPGKFLLTGSANILTLPALSESLAGRMEIFTLRPFSRGEMIGHKEGFVDRVFRPELVSEPVQESEPIRKIWTHVVAGGYPEVQTRQHANRRHAWFESYLTTILQRDVRELARIEGLTELPRLLQLLAARTGSLVNYAEISRSAGIPASTLKRYLALLEMTFLITEVPAWSSNLSKRLVKSGKLYVSDSGLASHLVGFDETQNSSAPLRGPLLETFVVAEITKQVSWSRTRPSVYHYRTSRGAEVDIVLESPAEGLVGIEVKSAMSVNQRDFRGLRSLRESVGPTFKNGVVLYGGSDVIPFDSDLVAVPLSALWSW